MRRRLIGTFQPRGFARFALVGLALVAACNRSLPRRDTNFHAELYVAGSTELRVFDAYSLSVVARIRVSRAYAGLTASEPRAEVYALDDGNRRIVVYDAPTHTYRAEIRLGRTPVTAECEPAGTTLLVLATHPDELLDIDPVARRIRRGLPVGRGPRGFAVNWPHRRAVVANHDDDSVSILDLAAGHSVATVKVGRGPSQIVLLPDGAKAFIRCDSDQVAVVDVERAVLLTNLLVGSDPSDMALKSDGGELCVANRGSASINIIDTNSNQVAATVLAGRAPSALLALQTLDGTNVLYVANRDSNTVSVIQIDDRRTVATIPVGVQPQRLRLGPYGQRLFVEDSQSSDIAVIDSGLMPPPLMALLPAPPNAGELAIVRYRTQ